MTTPRRAYPTPAVMDQPGVRRAQARRRTMWLALLLPLVLACTIGVTYALWGAGYTAQGGTFTAGNLEVTRGNLTWDCPDQGTSGDETTLPDLLLAPGETVVLHQAVTVTATGDNLKVALAVAFSGLPAGIEGGWHIEVDDVQVLPTTGDVPLDESIYLPGMGNGEWVVDVRLTVPAGDPIWLDPVTANPSDQALNLGMMTVTASQVRCGDGYVIACGSADV